MDKIKLNRYRSMLSTNQDSFMSLDLVNTQRELPIGDITKNVDLHEIYFDELNESNRYRFSLTINGMFTNILTNIGGEDSLAYFNNPIFKSVNSPLNNQGIHYKTDISFKESLENHLRIENGWVGYYKPNGLSIDCNLIELHPKKDDMYFIKSDGSKNWNFGLYYIASKRQVFIGHTGLPITHCDTVNYNGRMLYRFFTPFKHNLKIGESVFIGNIGNNTGNYTVIDLGDDDNNHKDTMFVLDLPNSPTIGLNTYFKRVVNGIPSDYYVRKLKLMSDIETGYFLQDHMDISQMGFANNIFGDTLTQIVFNKDYDTTDLIDYMGRQPIELVFGIIRSMGDEDSNITEIQSGYNLPYNTYFGNHIPDIRRLNGDLTPMKPLENNIIYNDEDISLDYDVIEFNSFEMKEYLISDIYHRFNLKNRVNNGGLLIQDNVVGKNYNVGVRKEGYMYKPFYSVRLLEESEYIEYGEDNDIIPNHALEYSPLKYKWRDIYDKTHSNINYPFLNGCHYIHNHVNFMLMRQDPFGNYGLIHKDFPKDQVGKPNRLKTEFIEINNKYDEC